MSDWRDPQFPWREHLGDPRPEDFDENLFRVMKDRNGKDKRAGQRLAVRETATGQMRCFPAHWFDEAQSTE